MMIISKTDYQEISFDKVNEILKSEWLTDTENLTSEQFKEELYIWLDMIK